jgi:NAD(P)-dependent dehydrogenase (short-subunit alcohol dehydrogenase family)
MEQYQFSKEEWESCIKVLEILKDNPFENPDNQTLKTLITAIHKQAKRQGKQESFASKKAEDFIALSATNIVAQAQQKNTHYTHIEDEGEAKKLHFAKYCYVCNQPYNELHFFYHKLCPACAATHYNYRKLDCDLSGRNVILTGGRVKIGYATALKLLRSGANLILTTRFPALAFEALSVEADYAIWKNHLTIYGLDLRNLKEINNFIAYCYEHLDGLDILINNAAQTIKYPSEYYRTLIAKEQQQLQLATIRVIANPTPVSEIPLSLPEAVWMENNLTLNRFGQPIDYRDKNSWNAMLNDVGLEELLEVNLINHIAPYCLISGLKALMLKSQQTHKFIINVTSSEGQFSYQNKNIFHSHTNMTKAALNMLTRTSGAEFIQDNIYMNAVDVGWVSTGAHESKREKLFNELRIPPLDPVDGAARIMHPIIAISEGQENWHGVLLKDYKVVEW